MKNQLKYRSVILCLFGVMLLSIGCQNLYAQKTKKSKVRLNVEYVKVMDGEVYFDIKVSSRIKKKTVKISNAEILIFNEFEEEKISLGKTITNIDGESRFKLKNLSLITSDSSDVYNVQFFYKGNDSLRKVKKNISFKDANISAKIIKKDSVNYVVATLLDGSTKNPIVDESLMVQVQRLFRPLIVGEEFNLTDETGSISVPIEEGIPGVDGNLNFEVVLNENDDYGTIKAIVTSNIGKPIKDGSTFDDRTMWSPRNKTPIFLLIFPNLLILGIWGTIVYLIINLFKISKL